MKRRLFLLVLLCILVSQLAGCAGELPDLPPLPGKETPGTAEEPVIEAVAETPVPTPAAVQELSLSVTLPASGQGGEETAPSCSSPANGASPLPRERPGAAGARCGCCI